MASWTTPVTHSSGDVIAVTDWNGLANDATFLYQAPYASYYNSVATSLSSSGWTQVTLGATDWSGYGFAVSSNNIVVPLTGVYSVAWAVNFASAPGLLAVSAIYQNGGEVKRGTAAPNAASSTSAGACAALKCSANDTIGLYAFQNSGGAINTATGSNLTTISISFVGSQ